MKQEIKILATNGDELVFTHDDANILLSINGTSPVIAKDHELFDADYNDGRFERNCKSLAKDYGYIKGWESLMARLWCDDEVDCVDILNSRISDLAWRYVRWEWVGRPLETYRNSEDKFREEFVDEIGRKMQNRASLCYCNYADRSQIFGFDFSKLSLSTRWMGQFHYEKVMDKAREIHTKYDKK